MVLVTLREWFVAVRGPHLFFLLVFVIGCNLLLGWLREPTARLNSSERRPIQLVR